MELSEKLKELRLEQKYTQQEIADKLGIIVESYRKYELGKRQPGKKSLEKLARVFDVSVSYLLGETNIRDTYEIVEIMEQLNKPRQEETLDFAKNKLIEQNSENKIIQLRNSLISYEVATDQALSAGLGEGYTDNIETTIVYWDKKVDYDIGIPIKGDSMEPDYQSGQIALIKYQSCPDHDGQVCAVDNISLGNAFIKCVTCQEDGILLESLNVELNQYGERKFPDKKISWEENPRIIGKVVAAFTPIDINNIYF